MTSFRSRGFECSEYQLRVSSNVVAADGVNAATTSVFDGRSGRRLLRGSHSRPVEPQENRFLGALKTRDSQGKHDLVKPLGGD